MHPRLNPLVRLTLVVTGMLATAAPRVTQAEDWPQFRGPTGQGVSTATGVPVEWGPSKNVAWKVKVPGRGWSSPVLANDRLYLTTAVGGNGKPITLWAFCLEAATGKVVWETEVFKPDQAAARALHEKNTLASATPIVDGDRLYVHFGHMGTAALDLAGKVVWRQTGIKYAPVHGNGGSPALAGNTLVFSCDGASQPFVVGLEAATGKIKWQTPRNTHAKKTFSFSTPLVIDVNGAKQAVLPGSGIVAAYDPESGKEVWRVRYGEGYSVVPRPVYADGLLFVSSGFDTATLVAIKPDGAKGDVTSTHVPWTHRKGVPTTPSMVVVGGEIYFVADNAVATCADAKTGKVHWTKRLGGGAGFSASPVAAEGRVYFQNEGGVGFVVKAGKAFEQLAENDLGERSLASYAVADGALYVRTDGHLWKIGSASGAK